ncbi:hypothetical protein OF83DRAFT_928651 [Amylostereum chailletii]|nr:hypothetical protein OF83DRAFT_928651 [Amylostereum chailletii]
MFRPMRSFFLLILDSIGTTLCRTCLCIFQPCPISQPCVFTSPPRKSIHPRFTQASDSAILINSHPIHPVTLSRGARPCSTAPKTPEPSLETPKRPTYRGTDAMFCR